MKHFFLLVGFLLGTISMAHAHEQPPITGYVQFSNTVCIAQVTAINNGVATFSVRETIKGKPPEILMLRFTHTGVPWNIILNSEWLLASTQAKVDTVGWAIKGDYGWVNAPIHRIDGKIHLAGNYGYVDPKLAADPSKGLTLEQLQELAKTPLPKQ